MHLQARVASRVQWAWWRRPAKPKKCKLKYGTGMRAGGLVLKVALQALLPSFLQLLAQVRIVAPISLGVPCCHQLVGCEWVLLWAFPWTLLPGLPWRCCCGCNVDTASTHKQQSSSANSQAAAVRRFSLAPATAGLQSLVDGRPQARLGRRRPVGTGGFRRRRRQGVRGGGDVDSRRLAALHEAGPAGRGCQRRLVGGSCDGARTLEYSAPMLSHAVFRDGPPVRVPE